MEQATASLVQYEDYSSEDQYAVLLLSDIEIQNVEANETEERQPSSIKEYYNQIHMELNDDSDWSPVSLSTNLQNYGEEIQTPIEEVSGINLGLNDSNIVTNRAIAEAISANISQQQEDHLLTKQVNGVRKINDTLGQDDLFDIEKATSEIIQSSSCNFSTCGKCANSFKTEIEFENHLKLCSIISITCELCDTIFISDLSLDKHNIRFHKEVNCSTCKKSFSGTYLLKEHMKKEHTQASKAYKKTVATPFCAICSKVFENQNLLIEHKLQHISEEKVKSIQCFYCEKRFTAIAHRRLHLPYCPKLNQ